MSVAAHEEPTKKKSKKALWISLLILLLIPVIAVGGYLFMINKAWNGSETIENAMPNEDGTVTTPHNDELQAIVDQAVNADTQIVNEETGATLAENVTEGDANGDGILDAVAGGAVTDRPVNTASTDILLLGSDQRSGAEAQVVTGARADTIMVLHIPEDGSAAYLISVMRDTWVNIPGYGSHKVNAGLNYGGVDLQVATIEQLLGIQMDHVAEIDFQGFKALVDTLGGVTVDVPFAFNATPAGYSFAAGPQTMTGGEALVFVRERYVFADGDYQRVRNQRAFLRGVYNELKADGALSSASKLLQVIESVSPYMSVDSGLSPSAIVGIAQPVLSNGNTQLVSMTLPNAGTGWSWDGQSIVVLDAAATSALSYALQTDTMPNYIATYGSD
ncbi:MAG: LCP family protein [Rothia sp. (in: high G+C Gram-positive bacteria)]|uniref:LCP family protein n=1 Tax=Rothia sp. (in: high G+C Gram-positive bacteria) TaxID=1885016 RepID=UPI00270AF682|nr:LCP family protein [Rothia sp. (in: high G+C Gram-positive bacteria)]